MANVVLLVPPVLLLGIAVRRPVAALLVASLASGLIEVVQAFVTALGRSCSTNDWLANMDRNADEIAAIMADVYGDQAALWTRRWRRFYLATAGLFGDSKGQVWGVSHYRLKKV